MSRSATLEYTAPFCVLIVLLALSQLLHPPALALQLGIATIMTAAIALTSGRVLANPKLMRIRNWPGAALIGVLVFAIWIAPDRIFPGYRNSWPFNNPIMGRDSGIPSGSPGAGAVLALRALRAAAIVPIAEELFWRGWLMRWLIAADFEAVPLGAWSALSFWIVALIFASEHGRYWDVGLAAGVIYNWWMLRTRSLGDLILTHAITNACLSAYVVFAGKWEYWQ